MEPRTYIVAYGSDCPFCGAVGEIAKTGPYWDQRWYWRCSNRIGCGCELKAEKTYSEASRKGHRRIGTRAAIENTENR